MPYRWEQTEDDVIVLRLWPFRSLTPQGHVWFVAITAGLLAVPLLAVLGSAVLWGLLPFALIALGGLMLALRRSERRCDTREVLVLTERRVLLTRSDPGCANRSWQANPYWVRVTLHEDGPVEDYLTLAGGGADAASVELGAFLSPPERIRLAGELRQVLAALRVPDGHRDRAGAGAGMGDGLAESSGRK